MFTALFSFLGGSAFRMVWGEVTAFVSKRQDHQHEVELLKVQKDLDDARHARDLEQLRLANELGIKTIEVQRDAAIAQAEADAFGKAIEAAARPSGIAWVDAWNSGVRPAFATVALALWVFKVVGQGFVMADYDLELLSVVAGFFFADRSLGKRGK
jgi:hypothetical protein